MILGIGTDICEIARIKPGQGFADKILSTKELEIFATKTSNQLKQAYLAKRFAAKEAVAKAFGTGIGKSLSFKDISVLNDENGAPFIEINSNNDLPNFSKIHISISDEKNYAIAYAVVEK